MMNLIEKYGLVGIAVVPKSSSLVVVDFSDVEQEIKKDLNGPMAKMFAVEVLNWHLKEKDRPRLSLAKNLLVFESTSSKTKIMTWDNLKFKVLINSFSYDGLKELAKFVVENPGACRLQQRAAKKYFWSKPESFLIPEFQTNYYSEPFFLKDDAMPNLFRVSGDFKLLIIKSTEMFSRIRRRAIEVENCHGRK
jgi:hypothetical protein